MSKTVVVKGITQKQDFPSSQSCRGIMITLGSLIPQMAILSPESNSLETTFTDVPSGDYIITATAVDAAGNPFGNNQASCSVTIPADGPTTIAIPIPTSITAEVQ